MMENWILITSSYKSRIRITDSCVKFTVFKTHYTIYDKEHSRKHFIILTENNLNIDNLMAMFMIEHL